MSLRDASASFRAALAAANSERSLRISPDADDEADEDSARALVKFWEAAARSDSSAEIRCLAASTSEVAA